MKGGHGAWGPKPGIDGDLFFLPVAQAAVIRDADVLLQLRDLWVSEQTWKAETSLWDTPAQKSNA